MFNPRIPRCHPTSWKLYHSPTAKGTVSPLQPSDGMILVVGPRLEGNSVIFLAIQTHLSCRLLLAVDSLGLLRSGSSSQFIDPPQDFPKQAPRHGNLCQLERDISAMADRLCADLDQIYAKRDQLRLRVNLRPSPGPVRTSEAGGEPDINTQYPDVATRNTS